MANEVYGSAMLREVKGKDAKGRTVRKCWQAVVKGREDNPDFKERPDGEDTRKPSEKRRYVWRQVAKNLDPSIRTKTAANKALQQWKSELEAKAARKSDAIGLVEYAEKLIADEEALGPEANGIEPSTARDYRITLRRIEKRFGDAPLSDLNADEVQGWITSEIKHGISATTMAKSYRLLNKVYRHARANGHVTSNPMDLVKPPKRRPSKPNALDEAGVKRLTGLLVQMEASPLATAVFLTLHAGLRCGEACGLRWCDVDLDNRVIHITRAIGVGEGGSYAKEPKTSKSHRDVPIDTELADKLAERKTLMRRQMAQADVLDSTIDFGSLYVCGDIVGNHAHPDVMARRWTSIAEDFCFIGTQGKRIKYVDLRHSYASTAIHAGQDAVNVAANMGHSSARMTLDVYSSPTALGQRQVADAIGDAMRPGEAKQADVLDMTGTDN